jgi:hypothetical protein
MREEVIRRFQMKVDRQAHVWSIGKRKKWAASGEEH